MLEHTAIEALAASSRNRALLFCAGEGSAELRANFLCGIRCTVAGEAEDSCLTLAVFDEYGDAAIGKPLLCLQLLPSACEAFEEVEVYEHWCRDEGYADTAFFRSLYRQYCERVPKFRALLGEEVKAVDYYHIEFNTDAACALRHYELEKD